MPVGRLTSALDMGQGTSQHLTTVKDALSLSVTCWDVPCPMSNALVKRPTDAMIPPKYVNALARRGDVRGLTQLHVEYLLKVVRPVFGSPPKFVNPKKLMD